MIFSSRISLKTLAILCRSLGTMLHSGVDILQSLRLAAQKSGNARCRQIVAETEESIREGNDLSFALSQYGDYFPGLMIHMVAMAEATGQLPEVLLNLAEHYEHNLELRRTFLRSIAWPAFQLVAAILVIALLILVLGLIAEAQGTEAMDVLGLGLSGPTGAVLWLTFTFGTFFLLCAGYQIASRSLRSKRIFDSLLMRVPVLGTSMQSFALARFSWAYYLTQQTGMPMRASLEGSLKATSNGAYMNAIPQICQMVERGETLSDALAESNLFPEEFLHVVKVGETSGTVPESLHRLSPQFEDSARRGVRTLAIAFGWLIWLAVAGFIIFFIFRVLFWYIGMINEATRGL